MSEIRKTAINSHKYDELSSDELNKLAKQFDDLTDEELKKELEEIKSMLYQYNSESVFLYRITMRLYEVVCQRHNYSFNFIK